VGMQRWDKNVFQCIEMFMGSGFLGVEGMWREKGKEVVIVNVYFISLVTVTKRRCYGKS